MDKKLGVIVPYRDRPHHLKKFLLAIEEYLTTKILTTK